MFFTVSLYHNFCGKRELPECFLFNGVPKSIVLAQVQRWIAEKVRDCQQLRESCGPRARRWMLATGRVRRP